MQAETRVMAKGFRLFIRLAPWREAGQPGAGGPEDTVGVPWDAMHISETGLTREETATGIA